jgi:hypothetical protein
METLNSTLGSHLTMVISGILKEIAASATSISRVVRGSIGTATPGTSWAEHEERRSFVRLSEMLRGSTAAQLHRLL